MPSAASARAFGSLWPGGTPEEGAELAARYLLERATALRGACAYQGRRKQVLQGRTPALFALGEQRIHRVPERAVRALFDWASGLDVEVRADVPDALHVLELQARGRRCVSLLPESVAHPAAAGFEFLVHDLCHLGKFTAVEHHTEQVGYFSTLRSLFSEPAWQSAERELDDAWLADRERLGADMNGSSVYLFSVLKMRLKMAARRALARVEGRPAPVGGALAHAERERFEALERVLCDALAWGPSVRAAALGVSARRDDDAAAQMMRAHFVRVGEAVLASTLG